MQPFKYNPNNHSGQFRHRISFQRLVENGSVDEDGFPTEGWEEVKAAWAMIKTVKGSEYFSAAAVQAERVYRFVIHYTEGITNDMKIKYDGRLFDIIEPPINDDEKNKTLTILAKEVVV